MAESKNTKKSSAKNNKKTTTKKTSSSQVSKTTKKPKTAVKTEKTKNVNSKPVVKKEVKEEVIKEVEISKNEEIKKATFVDIIKENVTIIILCILCLLLIINIILVVNGHKVKISDGKEIVASINDKNITAEDLFEEMKEKYGTGVLVNIIDDEIISKEISNTEEFEKKAKEQVSSIREQCESMEYNWNEVLTNYGYKNEQVLVDEIKNSLMKEEVVINYLSKNLSDEDIKKYYDEKIFDSFSAKHILITPKTNDNMSAEEKSAAEETAKNKAIEVINKLNSGENWSDLVKNYSQDTGSKENDGLVENFTKGDVVDEFYDATKNLNDGAYTNEPVKSKYGYHIILRVSKTEKEALDSMKDELISKIVDSKLNEDSKLYTTTWDEIRKKYNLEINDTVIKNNYEKTIKGE